MAKFFKTVDDIKTFISVTKAYSLPEFETRIQYSLDQYIVKWIGKAQLAALDAAYQLDPTPPLSTAQEELLIRLQLPLANFVFYEHIPFAQLTVDDSGIARKENENYKAAYQNQIELLRRNTLQTAYNSLETLLQFLEDNEGDYPLWVANSGYALNKSMLINKATVFNDNYSIEMSRLVFKRFVPTMIDVECFEIVPTLGQAYYDELKAAIANKTPLNASAVILLGYVQKAVAYFTIARAVEGGWTMFTPAGLVSVEHDKDTNSQIETRAEDSQTSLKIRQNTTTATQWIHKIEEYLRANPDAFPTWRDDISVNPPEDPDNTCPEKKNPKGIFRV